MYRRKDTCPQLLRVEWIPCAILQRHVKLRCQRPEDGNDRDDLLAVSLDFNRIGLAPPYDISLIGRFVAYG
jgi:hypothetical protein